MFRVLLENIASEKLLASTYYVLHIVPGIGLSCGRLSDSLLKAHYVNPWDSYMRACIERARDRTTRTSRSIDGYLFRRRDTVGCFVLYEVDLNIPEEVLNHPIIAGMRDWSAYMLITANVSSGSVNVPGAPPADPTPSARIGILTILNTLGATTFTNGGAGHELVLSRRSGCYQPDEQDERRLRTEGRRCL